MTSFESDISYISHYQWEQSHRIGSASVNYTAAVPEPATATLSLQALAGLAARRRRK